MQQTSDRPELLIRGVGLASATSLNMIDMIGVGPFITIPLIVAAMGGPQAMLGWIFGAVLVMCDGLVWAELGAAMPGSGGSYRYLKQIYNPDGFGKLMAFLFIWQLTFSAPLSIASGCIGLSQYASYLVPSLSSILVQHDVQLALPFIGSLGVSITLTTGTFAAAGTCMLAIVLLYRKITIVGRISEFLWVGVMLTIGWIIISGITHFNSERAFSFPPGAFTLSSQFFNGLGAGMLVAMYDYWGYYNVCFLGGEIKNPGRTIPRAIIASILLVAVIYLVMNISILGVIPWQELSETATSDARRFVISVFMQRLYGNWAGVLATVLIMWTAFASVFSLLLGYSRVPYAAALDRDYFKIFSRVHPRHRIPHVALLVLGIVAMMFCSLRLTDVIAALVVIRLMIQFLAQTIGVIVFRIRVPDVPRPFRMWFYPIPALVAFAGFVYVLIMRENFLKEIRYATVLIIVGLILYHIRAWRSREWPFAKRTAE
ncbi:MAG: APC family permease [Ignavibacteria bacterium]|nr:APC family permease [Ignavibacteria bacterium]MBI3765435.1 APC family permease [Ignavibacteriales bacterium]